MFAAAKIGRITCDSDVIATGTQEPISLGFPSGTNKAANSHSLRVEHDGDLAIEFDGDSEVGSPIVVEVACG